jgi:hypothetical protein
MVGPAVRLQALLSKIGARDEGQGGRFSGFFTGVLSLIAWWACIYTHIPVLYKNFTKPFPLVYPSQLNV